MFSIGDKIKNLRKNNALTQEDLADAIGISSQTLLNYETEKRQIPIDILGKIAIYFKIPIESFFNSEFKIEHRDASNKEETKKIPILENVSAGTGNLIDIYKDDNIKDWINISSSIAKKADFGTFIEGNSMEPRFHDGDLILVKKTDTLEPGEIGVFTLNEQVFCKKYDFNPFLRTIILKSLNPQYNPIKVNENDEFKIEGRVVSCIAYNI